MNPMNVAPMASLPVQWPTYPTQRIPPLQVPFPPLTAPSAASPVAMAPPQIGLPHPTLASSSAVPSVGIFHPKNSEPHILAPVLPVQNFGQPFMHQQLPPPRTLPDFNFSPQQQVPYHTPTGTIGPAPVLGNHQSHYPYPPTGMFPTTQFFTPRPATTTLSAQAPPFLPSNGGVNGHSPLQYQQNPQNHYPQFQPRFNPPTRPLPPSVPEASQVTQPFEPKTINPGIFNMSTVNNTLEGVINDPPKRGQGRPSGPSRGSSRSESGGASRGSGKKVDTYMRVAIIPSTDSSIGHSTYNSKSHVDNSVSGEALIDVTSHSENPQILIPAERGRGRGGVRGKGSRGGRVGRGGGQGQGQGQGHNNHSSTTASLPAGPSQGVIPPFNLIHYDPNAHKGKGKQTREDLEKSAPRKKTKVEHTPRQEPSDDADGHLIIKIGSDISSQYKIVKLLGEGTFGKVLECVDQDSRSNVAVKVIKNIQKYRDAAMCEINVFRALKQNDPASQKGVIHLIRWFEFKNHICMVFELMGQSVFDFLKDNLYYPFPLNQIQEFAKQILNSVTFIHELKLIHTDIKPENILLVNSAFHIVPSQSAPSKSRRALLSTNLKIIDFGSTIFENDYHSSVVCTRHYRAPEIVLGLGWSYPCDMWSVGCVLLELYTGEALFQTHENLEHLAMMEKILGKPPTYMTNSSEAARKFYDGCRLKYPDQTTPLKSEKRIAKLKPLTEMAYSQDPMTCQFFDLLRRLLEYDCKKRITATEALNHQFITQAT